MLGRRYVVVAAAAAFALLGSGCAEVTSGTPGATLSMAGFVQAGAKATLSQKTAHFTVTGTFGMADQSVAVTGKGDMDFTGHAMRLDMNMQIAGQSAVVSEIQAGGALYMSLKAGGTSMKDLVGKDWGKISIPGGVPTSGTGSSNPLDMLKYMSSAGATVTPISTTTIRGVAAKGYSVTIPTSVLKAEATKALNADPSMSASERDQILAGLDALSPVTMQVWFDPSKNLMMRMKMNLSLSIGGAGGFSGGMTFDFTQYDEPVSIEVPPASDTAPFPGTH